MSEHKLVPFEPTPEMVEAAEDAYMPFGDMELALRMAILTAPDVQGEPIGEVRLELGAQPYVFAELYSKSLPALAPGTKLYATPQPAEQQPEPVVAKMQRKLEASFQREEQLEREVRELKRERFSRFGGQECWMWAGDGSDRLETLTCPVVITPADLMAIINRGSPAPDVAGLVGKMERLITAGNRLNAEAEECTYDDGTAEVAGSEYWCEFRDALDAARAALAAPQPAPDASGLVVTLKSIEEWVMRYADPKHPVATVARKALADYRKQGGEA